MEQRIEHLAVVEWMRKVEHLDERTGFLIYKCSFEDALIDLNQIASPVHMLHLCDYVPTSQCTLQSAAHNHDWPEDSLPGMIGYEHDVLSNPFFVRNAAFLK